MEFQQNTIHADGSLKRHRKTKEEAEKDFHVKKMWNENISFLLSIIIF